MNALLRIASSFILVLVLASMAFACNISISGLDTQVRGDNDYYSSISANKNTDIDIKVDFTIDSYSGTDCPTNITANAKIYRYNSDTGNWELLRTASSKSQELNNDTYSFVWSNDFSTGSITKYTRYRVEGSVLNGSTQLDMDEAFIDVQDNSCSGISFLANNITINEGVTTTKTVTIRNNTNKQFDVSTLNLVFTSGIIKSGTVDYDTTIPSYSTRVLTMNLNAGYVSSNTTTTATLAMAGSLGSTNCSEYDIGRKNFDITVQNTGSIDDSGDDSGSISADCKEIIIQTRDFTIDEATENNVAFSVKNNSTRRFEITEVQVTSNGVELSNYYNEKYVFSGQLADIVLRAVAPAVTQNKIYDNILKIRGRFADGRSCSFDDIYKRTFNVTVNNQNDSGAIANCSNFSISAPALVEIENSGTVQFTITNGTNRSADIYVEGTVDASPTLITLPAKTSISRDLVVNMVAASGELYFRPAIDGCNIQPKQVTISNTAFGRVEQLSISTNAVMDQNTGVITLTIEINNPSNKVFNGVIEINTPQGWVANDIPVSVSQGRNFYTEKLTPLSNATQGIVTVTFRSNGEEISAQTDTRTATGFSGLFAFGTIAGSLGLFLVIIIVVLLLLGVIARTEPATDKENAQVWVDRK